MLRSTDHAYVSEQYGDASNLSARIALHARFSLNPQGWFAWLWERMALPPQAQVLEVGGGPGELWARNRERIPADWRVVVSDLSAGMVSTARGRLAGTALAFAVVDAQAIPFPTASFDSVIANHMLYHVPSLPAALAEMRRVLRPGGRFYAATIGRFNLYELRDMVRRFVPEAAGWEETEPESFLLEDGAAVLGQFFSQVDLFRYEDGLAVTEVEPLLAYVRSIESRLARADLGALAQFLERELARDGAVHIRKESGLFVAQ